MPNILSRIVDAIYIIMPGKGTVNVMFVMGRFTIKVTSKNKKMLFVCSIMVQPILLDFG